MNRQLAKNLSQQLTRVRGKRQTSKKNGAIQLSAAEAYTLEVVLTNAFLEATDMPYDKLEGAIIEAIAMV